MTGEGDWPAHVPAELIWDHDIDLFPAQFDDPYRGTCDALHGGPDIVWARGAYCGRSGWLLTRFALLAEVQMNPGIFAASLSRDVSRLLGEDVPLLPSESDPPDHKTYRQFIQPWFQPKFVKQLEPRIRQICTDLIDKFAARGECEFVGEFSSLFPSSVTLLMLGLPHHMLGQFLEWENKFLRGSSMDVRVKATRELYDYFGTLLEERRRRPGDDMVSMIANGELDGRRLAENEARGMCIMLYIGGLDSVTSGLGWYMRHLAMDQELQSKLRNEPGLIPASIEEFVRFYGTNNTMRTVTRETVFHGVGMRLGDVVALPTFLSSRDPREYDRPHEFDMSRQARTMTFGTGVHKCAGIHLAKCEIAIVLEEFLGRFAGIAIAEGQRPIWTSQTIWGVKQLPLTLEA